MKPHLIRRRLPGLLLLSLLTVTGAAAQTALLDVPGNGGANLFQLNNDAGLLVKGTFATGTIPATGAGMRLMWYPKKAAFRAGRVLVNAWDDANIGNYSVAMGFNTMASQTYATALGSGTLASGQAATALGNGTEASGDNATALGVFTTAGGLTSTAMGNGTEASGDYATAMGNGTEASGLTSTAMGNDTEASGDYATALGFETTASHQYAVAMGRSTTASGIGSTAMGEGTTASGDWSTAMGRGTTAGQLSTALGDSTMANRLYATAMGRSTTADGIASTVMGIGTTAQAYASLVLGRYNVIAGQPTIWASTEPILVVGNGGSTGSPSNALTLLKNGNLTIAGTLTENSDRRLKRDLQPLTDALDGIARLQPVRYRFREGTNRPEGQQIGLIAQEVEAVFPELVSRGADGYLSVSYTHLVAVLVQALNEQHDQIDALNDRLARLETLLAGIGGAQE